LFRDRIDGALKRGDFCLEVSWHQDWPIPDDDVTHPKANASIQAKFPDDRDASQWQWPFFFAKHTGTNANSRNEAQSYYNNEFGSVFVDDLFGRNNSTDRGRKRNAAWLNILKMPLEFFLRAQEVFPSLTILYRPYHEVNAGNLWWSLLSKDDFRKLFAETIYYMRNNGAHNLLTVLCFMFDYIKEIPTGANTLVTQSNIHSNNATMNLFVDYMQPDVVDIVGIDVYLSTLSSGQPKERLFSAIDQFASISLSYNKLPAISEFGMDKLASDPAAPSASYSIFFDELMTRLYAKKITYFMAWREQIPIPPLLLSLTTNDPSLTAAYKNCPEYANFSSYFSNPLSKGIYLQHPSGFKKVEMTIPIRIFNKTIAAGGTGETPVGGGFYSIQLPRQWRPPMIVTISRNTTYSVTGNGSLTALRVVRHIDGVNAEYKRWDFVPPINILNGTITSTLPMSNTFDYSNSLFPPYTEANNQVALVTNINNVIGTTNLNLTLDVHLSFYAPE
jgi:hypothetical protein